MRKISLLIVALVLAAGSLAAWHFLGSGRGGAEILPEVLSVTPASAVIAWTTETPVRGAVVFRPAGGGEEKEVREPQEPGFRHEVPLSGLSPSTRYAYRLEGGQSWFLLETQPVGADPFFFLMVNSRDPGEITRAVLAESPDFVMTLSPPAPNEPDPFQDVRPFVPVFSSLGPVSPFLGEPSAETRSRPWHALDWGGYRLAFVHAPGPIPGMLDSPASFFLVVADPGVVPGTGPGSPSFADRVRGTPLHQALLAHNQAHGDRAADLVFLLGDREKAKQEKVDGVAYLAVPSPAHWPASSRVEMDGALVRSMPLDGKPAVVLRQPAVARRLTCRECRQLAERGAYEESVRAYETFVRENAGNFQVDDAEYAIAQICDEKLFDYPRALTWYQRLLADQPDSALAPLARQRIRFITQWDAADLPALAAFERIRNVDYALARDPAERARLLTRVDALARANPGSRLAPVMLRWRAGQMSSQDPGAAVHEFMRLQKEYPQSPEAADAWMAVGETWYAAGRYREALAAFARAEERPEFAQAARAQADRGRRNIRRVQLCLAAWIVLALVGIPGLALAFRPPVPGPGWKAALPFPLLGAALLAVAWFIQEEFSSLAELAILALSPAVAGYAAVRLSASIALALPGLGRAPRALAGTVLSILFFLAAMYLAVYYVNVHYLITFRL